MNKNEIKKTATDGRTLTAAYTKKPKKIACVTCHVKKDFNEENFPVNRQLRFELGYTCRDCVRAKAAQHKAEYEALNNATVEMFANPPEPERTVGVLAVAQCAACERLIDGEMRLRGHEVVSSSGFRFTARGILCDECVKETLITY